MMSDESKFWLVFSGIVAVVLMTAIVGTFWYNAYTTEIYVKAGYQAQPVIGVQGTVWQKAGAK